MNLYTSLTFRYLKENKKRTIVTIIGIILSTALICGIGNIFESFMDYQIRQTISDKGSYHATFDDVKKEDRDIITKSAGVESFGYSNDVGFAALESKRPSIVDIKAYDKNIFDSFNLIIQEGKFPTKENEIILSEEFLKLCDKKVGDTLILDVGRRVGLSGDEVSGSYVDGDEKITDTKTKKYKIVGIMYKPVNEFGKQVIKGITYLDINKLSKNDTVQVSISANKPEDIYEVAGNISENLGFKIKSELPEEELKDENSYYYNNENETYYENITFNEHLLRLQGASAYGHINESLKKIIIFVTTLVIICTIATVYNAFSISISERKRQFGILNSIGATRSQTMKLVFLEAFIVSVIGIPLGLLSGTVAIDVVFTVISNLFPTSMIGDMGLRVVYSPYVIILSTIIVLLTIFISAILPAISASKTSPLDAIKNSDSLKIGKVKNTRIVKALFKTEGVLAYKNLRRNKKKFRITLFSLIVSVVIFISFSGFMTLFMKANTVQMGQINYDLSLYNNSRSDDKEITNKLKEIPGVKRIANGTNLQITTYLDEDKVNEKNKELVNDYFGAVKEKGVYQVDNSNMILPGDFEIGKIKLKEGSFSKKDALKEKGVILVDKSYYEEEGKKAQVSLTKYKVGDMVKGYISTYDEEKQEDIKIETEFKVLAITDDIVTGNSQYSYMGLDYITYDEVGEKIGFNSSNGYNYITDGNIYLSTNKDEKESRKKVKEIAEKYGYDIIDQLEEVKALQDTLMVMQIFVYGFVTVISLVSITNIVNTISTNINLRKKELAIIKSIGVTPGGFNKMIYLESLLYGGLALLYGVPIGLILVIAMNVLLGSVIEFGLVLPWESIFICIIGLFLITFISAYIPMKKINKENIIDNIRQESI